MEKIIKKLFVILSVSLLFLMLGASTPSVFGKHLKYRKPYASTLTLPSPVESMTEIGELEEADEYCTDDTCGEDEDDAEEEVVPPPPPTCKEDTWDCGSWGTCLDGKQARKCKITNDCAEVTTASPATSQKCEVKEAVTPPPPPPEPPPPPTCKEDTWDCGSWGTCLDGEQARKCKITNDCAGVTTASPATSQKCEVKEEVAPPPPPAPEPPPPAPPKEDEMKKAAEEQAAKEALEKKKLEEEEAKRLEEEAAQREEELKKAEAEAFQRAQEELAQKAEEERNKQEELKRVLETPVFKEIFEEKPIIAAPIDIITELKKNAGVDPAKVDRESTKKEAEFVVNMQEKVEKKEVREEEARKLLNQEQKKEKEKEKRVLIAKASERKFRHKLREAAVRERGISDEVLVLHGENPKEEIRAVEKDTFAYPFEKKLFGVPKEKTIVDVKKATIGISNGSTVSAKGIAILATCPTKNVICELHAINSRGIDSVVAKNPTSENNKLIFTFSLPESGNHVFRVEPVSPLSARFPYFASTLNAGAGEESDPVLVSVVADSGIPEPVVESIEGVHVAGLRDIQISASADGKITVSGSSDITTMVIGTFSSAVFTSAMLADIDSGRFEVVSPRALEAGQHEVVIYATRPEEATQSVPVKLKFNLIGVAKAEAPVVTTTPEKPDQPAMVVSRTTAPEKKFPLVPFLAFGGLAILLISIGIFLKKSKKSTS